MEESLKKKHQEFVERLYKPLIFYIPRRLYTEFDKKGDWDNEKYDGFFDTVVLIKDDGRNKVLGDGPSNFYILPKGVELGKNTYDLFDLKEKQNDTSFKFLLENYLKNLIFYVKISKWMYENIKIDVKDIRDETLFSFQKQMEIFQEHWNYVQEHFNKPTQTIFKPLVGKLGESDFKFMNSLMKVPMESFNDKEGKQLTQKRKKDKKKVLVTTEEAEQFLLKSVFNIKSEI